MFSITPFLFLFFHSLFLSVGLSYKQEYTSILTQGCKNLQNLRCGSAIQVNNSAMAGGGSDFRVTKAEIGPLIYLLL